jgi:predicted transcriptional regulator
MNAIGLNSIERRFLINEGCDASEEDGALLMDDLEVITTAEIVAAYVANNSFPTSGLPQLIADVHAALHRLGQPAAPAEAPNKPQPAVAVKRSVTPDFIICLEDGRKFKSLKRHLKASHHMAADEYRAKWGLPKDYPMVAPNYAAKRRDPC